MLLCEISSQLGALCLYAKKKKKETLRHWAVLCAVGWIQKCITSLLHEHEAEENISRDTRYSEEERLLAEEVTGQAGNTHSTQHMCKETERSCPFMMSVGNLIIMLLTADKAGRPPCNEATAQVTGTINMLRCWVHVPATLVWWCGILAAYDGMEGGGGGGGEGNPCCNNNLRPSLRSSRI